MPESVLIQDISDGLENITWVSLVKNTPKGRVEFCFKKYRSLLAFIRDKLECKLKCKWHYYFTVK